MPFYKNVKFSDMTMGAGLPAKGFTQDTAAFTTQAASLSFFFLPPPIMPGAQLRQKDLESLRECATKPKFGLFQVVAATCDLQTGWTACFAKQTRLLLQCTCSSTLNEGSQANGE